MLDGRRADITVGKRNSRANKDVASVDLNSLNISYSERLPHELSPHKKLSRSRFDSKGEIDADEVEEGARRMLRRGSG